MRKSVFVALRMAGIAGQAKLAGIFRYLTDRYGDTSSWNMTLVRTHVDLTRRQVEDAVERGIDGFIVSIPNSWEAIAPLGELTVPTVLADMGGEGFTSRKSNIVVIRNSAREIARAAALFLMGQGVARAYAYLHAANKPDWSVARYEAFRDMLRGSGLWCAELSSPQEVARLKRGTAILAASDDTAFGLVDYLHKRRLKVPGDYAVLGIDNDKLICENSFPRLSSVQPDFEEEGYLAAETLDEMMHSKNPVLSRTLLAGVKDVVRRESTAEVSNAGRLVQKAVSFIGRHALEDIGVDEVVRHLGCSRRLADLRFRELQGRSILAAITERRLDEVKRRLLTTRDTMDTIASHCGYSNPNYLKNLFKKKFHMTMSEFRRLGARSAAISAKEGDAVFQGIALGEIMV